MLVDNTIPTWFISHASSTIFSSALFEMAFLGVKPLSFMTSADDLFENDCLEEIGSNISGKPIDLNLRIKEFIDELLSTELSNMEVQIKQRAEILGIELDEHKNSMLIDKSKSEVFCA